MAGDKKPIAILAAIALFLIYGCASSDTFSIMGKGIPIPLPGNHTYKIYSEPSGAEIYFNDKLKGKAPIRWDRTLLFQTIETIKIEARMPGHETGFVVGTEYSAPNQSKNVRIDNWVHAGALSQTLTGVNTPIHRSAGDAPRLVLPIGHTFSISSVAFSPDGRYALSGSRDHTLKLWEVSTGRELRTFKGHKDIVYSVAFSPNSHFCLSGSSDKTMKLWDVSTGREVRTFAGHKNLVHSVAFSPNGRYALSGSWDCTLKLWEVSTGREVRTFKGHKSVVISVAFSSDGRYALSGSQDNTMKLWKVSTGRQVRTFAGHKHLVSSVAFSPNGRYALSGSYDKTLKLWEISTGRQVRTFPGHKNQVLSIAFSPDGRHALSGSGFSSHRKVMKLWEVSTGRQVRTFSGHKSSVNSVAFSPNGRYALSGSSDKTLKLWDVSTGRELSKFPKYHFLLTTALSPNGRYAISGCQDKTLEVWELFSGRRVHTYKGHKATITSIAFSPDNRYVLSAQESWDHMKLWEMATASTVRTFYKHKWVRAVAFSPDGRYALSASADHTLKIWEVSTGREVRIFAGHKAGVTSVAFSPDGRYALSGSWDKTLKLWDVSRGREVRTFAGHNNHVHSTAFSPDGRYALSASADHTLKLWDVSNGSKIRTFKGHKGTVTVGVFSPDGRYVLSGSSDNTMKLWELATGRVVRNFLGQKSPINFVAFSSNGRYVTSSSLHGSFNWYDKKTGDLLLTRICTDQGDWIVATPGGHYDGSPRGLKFLHYTEGDKSFAINPSNDPFYTPNLVAQVISMRGSTIGEVSGDISNVDFRQETNMVIITYDFAGNKSDYHVAVKCSRDGGAKFDIIPKAVSGDVDKNVKPGKKKKIYWDVLKDFPQGLSGDSFAFRVEIGEAQPLKARLFVKTEPKGARARILNIRPRFHQGIELKPGRYHIEVSAKGYLTKKRWIEIIPGEKKQIEIRLAIVQGKCVVSIDATEPTRSAAFNNMHAGTLGQSFTAVDASVYGFQFKIGNGRGIHGAISEDSYAVLYDVSDTKPVELVRKRFPAPITGVTDFLFDHPIPVEVGKKYFIGIDTKDNAWGLYQTCNCVCSCYNGGGRGGFRPNGAFYGGKNDTDDYYFKVYTTDFVFIHHETSAIKDYCIQLASLKKKSVAQRMVKTLMSKGYPVYCQEVSHPTGITYYRVRCGPWTTKSKARKQAQIIVRRERIKGFIVPLTKKNP